MQRNRNFFVRVVERMREKDPVRWRDRDPPQHEIGALIGIRQPSVAKWKAGKLPEMKHAIALAEKLHVCVEWLLTERGPKFPAGADPGLQSLLAVWTARPDLRAEIADYAAYLASRPPAQKKAFGLIPLLRLVRPD